MQLININEILNTISSLSLEEQYFIVDTLTKRIQDRRRSQIAARGQQAQENYQQGMVTSGTVADLMRAVADD
ncbi:hypothetical protein THII_3935 [Thioploca ingrica]|jgi:hypothetical protein|uniref:Uncharacterized protein n=1 Tax=Thioploca ingrica TaxID=40754 RepID=A0A090APL4_9GAMM|nr:hypothetical protein THII_3935 [Thioploca ingrica]